jgi:hypothetical protein
MNRQYDLTAIARRFKVPGEFLSAAPYGTGHINDTYCVIFDYAGCQTRYVLQRINHSIFKNPVANMENIQRVTSHLAAQIAGEPDAERRVLTLIPTWDEAVFHLDSDGNYWRMYLLIENAISPEAAESPEQAFQAGKAFGQFQKLLTDLPTPRLHVTIPDFHHVPKRFAALKRAIESDVAGRAILAKPEIEFALAHQPITDVLLKANLPERITHNDTKFSNLLLDEATGNALCVIDLDTVMPGLALNDFGDMVRTTTSPAAEDEQDLSRVGLQMPMFEALLRGYFDSAGEFLTRTERQHLAFSGKLITFVMGIRLLTDYLSGDTYYKVHREGHNLDRCRTQFELIRSIEQQEDAMNRLVESLG